MSNEVTFTIGREELVIRQRWEVVSIVNDILVAFHPDYAALRRYLVDDGFLDRADNVYWRSGGSVDV